MMAPQTVPKPTPQFSDKYFNKMMFLVSLGGAVVSSWCIYRSYFSDLTNRCEESPSNIKQEVLYFGNENGNPNVRKVILSQSPRGLITPCISPFALKLETFLRVAKIPYEIEFYEQPQENGTPWLIIEGEKILEHHLCIKKLREKFSVDLEANATKSRLAASRMVNQVLENEISWAISLWRWVFDEGKSLPKIQPAPESGAKSIIENVRNSVISSARYVAMGRLTKDEVIEHVITDLYDLSAALGRHKYFMGETPGEIDCNVFAHLVQMIWNMPESPFETKIQGFANLIEFVERMKEYYWPDWDQLISKPSESNELLWTQDVESNNLNKSGISSQHTPSVSSLPANEPVKISSSSCCDCLAEAKHSASEENIATSSLSRTIIPYIGASLNPELPPATIGSVGSDADSEERVETGHEQVSTTSESYTSSDDEPKRKIRPEQEIARLEKKLEIEMERNMFPPIDKEPMLYELKEYLQQSAGAQWNMPTENTTASENVANRLNSVDSQAKAKLQNPEVISAHDVPLGASASRSNERQWPMKNSHPHQLEMPARSPNPVTHTRSRDSTTQDGAPRSVSLTSDHLSPGNRQPTDLEPNAAGVETSGAPMNENLQDQDDEDSYFGAINHIRNEVLQYENLLRQQLLKQYGAQPQSLKGQYPPNAYLYHQQQQLPSSYGFHINPNQRVQTYNNGRPDAAYGYGQLYNGSGYTVIPINDRARYENYQKDVQFEPEMGYYMEDTRRKLRHPEGGPAWEENMEYAFNGAYGPRPSRY